MKNSLTLRFIGKYYRRVKYSLFVILLIVPITALFEQLVPWYVSKIINLINMKTVSEALWSELLSLFAVLAVMLLSGSVLTLFIMNLMQKNICSPVGKDTKLDLFTAVLGQHQNFWRKNNAGDVFGKIDTIRRTIAAWSSLGDILFWFYSCICTLLITLYLMAQIYRPLAVVYFVSGAILIIIFHKISTNTFQAATQSENLHNRVFGRMVNMIGNHFVLKIFGSLNREVQKLNKDYTILGKSIQKEAWLEQRNKLLLNATLVIFECLMIVYAVVLWAKGLVKVGDIIYILNSVMSLGRLLEGIIDIWMRTRSRLRKMRTNLDTFNEKPEICDIEKAKKLKINHGNIEFKNLTFAYGNNAPVIKDFNLQIKAGEKVGIVGMSGSGKTTLLHLLQRLINTPENMVYIDGQDISKVTQESLHQAIAFIPQDTSLFHRSLAENIAYGKFGAMKKEWQTAAKQAYVTEFVNDLPQGYDTLVGDKGVKLSGGQRQRVGIARAILKNSKILLLDEATSALDSKSEIYIQRSLQKLILGKTVLVVAHRLATLKNMDRIIVLEKGRIIEDGSPEKLLKEQGKFAKLWKLQA